jgi:dTDP-4-dehydrorhamnose reductase
MKILLFGKNGQVGWELSRSLLSLGEVIALGREDADFSNPDSLRKIVQEVRPDIIVNAVAYTAVDKAEEDELLATVINGVAPGVLAEESLKLKALLIHYSTDYVFDGTKASAYVEEDVPNPINAYGRSKLAGEVAIQNSACDFLIFRTSWVYSTRGNNFLLTILRLAKERSELSVVADQFGAPTWARTIAQVTSKVISQIPLSEWREYSGLYHLVASGKTSWHGFAQAIVDIAKQDLNLGSVIIKKISAAEYPTPAKRPNFSVLNCARLSNRFDMTMDEWHESLSLCMAELLESTQ